MMDALFVIVLCLAGLVLIEGIAIIVLFAHVYLLKDQIEKGE